MERKRKNWTGKLQKYRKKLTLNVDVSKIVLRTLDFIRIKSNTLTDTEMFACHPFLTMLPRITKPDN